MSNIKQILRYSIYDTLLEKQIIFYILPLISWNAFDVTPGLKLQNILRFIYKVITTYICAIYSTYAALSLFLLIILFIFYKKSFILFIIKIFLFLTISPMQKITGVMRRKCYTSHYQAQCYPILTLTNKKAFINISLEIKSWNNVL